MVSYKNVHMRTDGKYYAEIIAKTNDIIDITNLANGSSLLLIDEDAFGEGKTPTYYFDEDTMRFWRGAGQHVGYLTVLNTVAFTGDGTWRQRIADFVDFPAIGTYWFEVTLNGETNSMAVAYNNIHDVGWSYAVVVPGMPFGLQSVYEETFDFPEKGLYLMNAEVLAGMELKLRITCAVGD